MPTMKFTTWHTEDKLNSNFMLAPRRGGTRSSSDLLGASFREVADRASLTEGDAQPDASDLVSVDVAALLRAVSCPLCRGVFRDACTINECIHSFCRECIEAFCSSSVSGAGSPVAASRRGSSGSAFPMRRRVCPQCGGPITTPPFSPDPVLQSVASKLSRQCAASAEGRGLLEAAEAARDRHRTLGIEDASTVAGAGNFSKDNVEVQLTLPARSRRGSRAPRAAAASVGRRSNRKRARAESSSGDDDDDGNESSGNLDDDSGDGVGDGSDEKSFIGGTSLSDADEYTEGDGSDAGDSEDEEEEEVDPSDSSYGEDDSEDDEDWDGDRGNSSYRPRRAAALRSRRARGGARGRRRVR